MAWLTITWERDHDRAGQADRHLEIAQLLGLDLVDPALALLSYVGLLRAGRTDAAATLSDVVLAHPTTNPAYTDLAAEKQLYEQHRARRHRAEAEEAARRERHDRNLAWRAKNRELAASRAGRPATAIAEEEERPFYGRPAERRNLNPYVPRTR